MRPSVEARPDGALDTGTVKPPSSILGVWQVAVPSPVPRRPVDPNAAARALERVRAVSRWMDTRYRIPGTAYRFGLDPIISLLPVVGDTLSLAIGLYPIVEASRLGVRRVVLLRMLANLGLDWLVGLVPVVGIIPDAWYKANTRNLGLLERELGRIALGPES
ncbi:MAG: hypothetical protein KatS3mg103_1161 [Phycisphaerales bacterium]|nr:MAG: hypothetical protein KatS3mg103_1161 [Phycisphaerales bacterium]